MSRFNDDSTTPMDLVIFSYVIEHLARVCRILKQPLGHGLLIGVGGTGRSSVARLAAFVAEYELVQFEVTKTYGVSEWRADLKHVLRKTGENAMNSTDGGAKKAVETVLLFADAQIKDEVFLEDINMLLNAGFIPSLFDNDERTEIVEKVNSF